MAGEKFMGKWKSVSMENFDEYMKALEVNLILRKAGAFSTTNYEFRMDGEFWILKYKIAFKSGEIRCRLGEPFDEVTPDGRQVKTTLTLEGDNLVAIQQGKPMETSLTRRIEEGGDTMIEYLKAGDVVCKRIFKRVEE